MTRGALRVGVIAGCALAWAAAAGAAPLSPPDEAAAERTESMCRINAQELGDTGKALDAAITQCVAEVAPSLAYWEHCRQGARRSHLRGLALRDDVRACMSREP